MDVLTSIFKRKHTSAVYENGHGSTSRHRMDTRKRMNEGHNNDHDSDEADIYDSWTDNLPRPNDESWYGTNVSRMSEDWMGSNEIEIIPVPVTLSPGRLTCNPENWASSITQPRIPLVASSASPAEPSPVFRPGTTGETPASCLELARARAFQEGVLPVHQFLQFKSNHGSPSLRPIRPAAREHPGHTRLKTDGSWMELIESMYANVSQPIPHSIRHMIEQQEPSEETPGGNHVGRHGRRSRGANEELRRLQSER